MLLGTGTPSPDPKRSGPATAIVVNDTPYLIDFGPMATYNTVSPAYQEYRRKHHTSSREVAEITKKARPGLLILYHRANPGGVGRPNPEQALLDEVAPLRISTVLCKCASPRPRRYNPTPLSQVGGGMMPLAAGWLGAVLSVAGPDADGDARDRKSGYFDAGRATPIFRTRLLTIGSEISGFGAHYHVTPDGQRFLNNGPPGDPGPPIRVVLNWAAGLT